VLFGGDAGVGHFATGVNKGDEFGRIFLQGVMGDLFAVFNQGVHKMQDGEFAADAFEFGGIDLSALAKDIGSGLRLGAGALADELAFAVVLKTAEPPGAEVVFGNVFGGIAEAFDDGLVRNAVVEHEVNLMAELGGKSGDFAVTTRAGLASGEFGGEGDGAGRVLLDEWIHGIFDC